MHIRNLLPASIGLCSAGHGLSCHGLGTQLVLSKHWTNTWVMDEDLGALIFQKAQDQPWHTVASVLSCLERILQKQLMPTLGVS